MTGSSLVGASLVPWPRHTQDVELGGDRSYSKRQTSRSESRGPTGWDLRNANRGRKDTSIFYVCSAFQFGKISLCTFCRWVSYRFHKSPHYTQCHGLCYPFHDLAQPRKKRKSFDAKFWPLRFWVYVHGVNIVLIASSAPLMEDHHRFNPTCDYPPLSDFRGLNIFFTRIWSVLTLIKFAWSGYYFQCTGILSPLHSIPLSSKDKLCQDVSDYRVCRNTLCM